MKIESGARETFRLSEAVTQAGSSRGGGEGGERGSRDGRPGASVTAVTAVQERAVPAVFGPPARMRVRGVCAGPGDEARKHAVNAPALADFPRTPEGPVSHCVCFVRACRKSLRRALLRTM